MKIFNFENKYVGDIIDGIYYSQRTPKHFMIKFNGFGISKSILDELKKNDVRTVQINYLGHKGVILYSCSSQKFYNSEKTFIFRKNDINDLQLFVSIDDMSVIKER